MVTALKKIDLYTRSCLSKKYKMSSVNVKVVVRVRPQNKIEVSRGGSPCVQVNKENTEINVEDGYNSQKWTFDCVFAPLSTQPQVFEVVGAPVVDAVFQGFNGTIFAYGQTSSGKTHTMTGPDGKFVDPAMSGVIPRCVDAIFEKCTQADSNLEFTVQAMFMEIYLERVKDLLNVRNTNLSIREDLASGRGIYVEGKNYIVYKKLVFVSFVVVFTWYCD
tara:strand:- start:124 stop:780 length:657 start_codon:yes stop_codon:yes gene_type:complete